MKIEFLNGEEELPVAAISWPIKKGNNPDFEDHDTQLSVYDGDRLYEVSATECKILNYKSSEYVLDLDLDERFGVLMWRPLFELDIWPEVRDFEPAALKRLREIFEKFD